jgi:ectoine hydroxylase-related dioxygenase (phytanoyl-CoA dioxygenase family)
LDEKGSGMNIRSDSDAILECEDQAGYCVVPDVIGPEHADAARQALAALECRRPGETICSTRNVVTKHTMLRDLVRHPGVLELRQRLLGADMVCSSCTAITLLPGHDGMAWHVDYPYWSIQPPYPTWDLAAYALWMLDDFTIDNGATGIIPNSHRRAFPPQFARDHWPADAAVAVGRKGSVLLAKGPYWHTARPNPTAVPRSAVMVSYLRAFCIPHTDMQRQLRKLHDPSASERTLFGMEQFVPRNEDRP